MIKKRSLAVVLCAVVAFSPLVTAAPQAYSESRAAELERDGETPDQGTGVSEDPQVFREQLLRFLKQTEVALQMALEHPTVGTRLRKQLAGSALQIPLPPEAYASIENATVEDLDLLRTAFVQAPDGLSVAPLLISALQQIPRVEETAGEKASCSDNYVEYGKVLSNTNTFRALTRASNSLDLIHSVGKTISDSLVAASEDIPIIGSKFAIGAAIIAGIVEAIQLALAFAADEIDFQITDSELCLAGCLADADDIHGDGSENWRGKGCDNRDNNCTNGIDEPAEDRFLPTISIDPSLLLQCYDNVAAADAAVQLAVAATDDCSDVDPTINVTDAGCNAILAVQAADANANTATAGPFNLIVDGDAPVIGAPNLAQCYATLGDAHTAFAMTPVSDTCSAVDTSINVVEKECVADLELVALDECDNRSTAQASVRVDGSPPQVNIEKLLIPAVDGLSCFVSEKSAIDAVAQATKFSDNCSAIEDLMPTTVAAGDECTLEVTSSAQDECGQSSSDSLVVRVDAEAPVLSCSVAIDLLDPALEQMVDVGFVLNVNDNCDGTTPDIEVFVTSDEATKFAYTAVDGDDPYPDAIVTRTPNGGVESILLRAQRRTGAEFDGRVYRIRTVATDSCGLRSETDCYVTVPPTPGPPATAVNSGQAFDATALN